MSKVMLINVTHPEESRVGIVKDGVLEVFEIESLGREHLKGSIYKGVVHRIHPALEAAFVDIGLGRDAFLPLDEICFRNLPGNGRPVEGRPRIKDVLKPGQELLVQIAKDEFASKPPTLSTFYSLPGRYLVLLPGSEESGISRKIEGEDRVRLRALIQELKPPEGFGLIVRTVAGFDQDRSELERDLAYLLRLWETIQKSAEAKKGVGLVYREHDLVVRSIRDYFTPDIDEIYIDNEEVYRRARDFVRNVMPGREGALRLYTGDQPIFSRFGVESQIETIYKRRVPLKSGGSIVIDGTEALTAIDVNSGGSVRGGSQEETAFRTNLEAAAEIARQLRLRDIGGLIVIDFIDMRQPSHIHAVERALAEAMKPDKARYDIGKISRFGLLEISRQRLRPAAAATTYRTCPMCEGHGHVRTTESAALVAFRKIQNRVAQGDVGVLRVTLPPDVAIYLLNQKREDLALLERRYGVRIQVATSEKLMPHEVEIDVRAAPKEAPGPRPGEVVMPEVPAVEEPAPENVEAESRPAAESAPAAGGEASRRRSRRRRRRGRGRGRKAAQAIAEALGALAEAAGLRRVDAEAAAGYGAAPEEAARGTEPPASGGSPPANSASVAAGVPPTEPAAPEAESRTEAGRESGAGGRDDFVASSGPLEVGAAPVGGSGGAEGGVAGEAGGQALPVEGGEARKAEMEAGKEHRVRPEREAALAAEAGAESVARTAPRLRGAGTREGMGAEAAPEGRRGAKVAGPPAGAAGTEEAAEGEKAEGAAQASELEGAAEPPRRASRRRTTRGGRTARTSRKKTASSAKASSGAKASSKTSSRSTGQARSRGRSRRSAKSRKASEKGAGEEKP
ncbi:MAG: hypothetical protein KatS3mg076_2165 [Candidatus Binatia bacterium]|nr:MAG: hypothetical protein KatS3mg076_2165 [Candidatus Binatia bacterium]